MRQSQVEYRVGRFHVDQDFASPDAKHEFILSGLHYGGTVAPENTKFEWGFFDVACVQVGERELLTGNLVKFTASVQAKAVDKGEHRVYVLMEQNRVVAEAPFFIDTRTGLIAFRPIDKGISIDQFRGYFCRIFREAKDVFFHPEIDMVSDDVKISEEISRLKTVTSVTVTLHPSNPNYREAYRPIDQDMKDRRVTRYKVEYHSTKPGGMRKPVEGDVLYNHILMAEDAYGDAKVVGETADKQKRVVTTRSQPVSARVPVAAERSAVAKIILQKFRDVMKRIRR